MTPETLTHGSLRSGDRDVVGSGGMAVHLQPRDSVATMKATWRLDEEGLNVDLHVVNQSRLRAPFSVSVTVDLQAVGERVQALVPAEEVVVDGRAVPVSGRFDLRRPRTVDEPLEAHFSRRHFANLRTSAAVLAPDEKREVWFLNSADFHGLEVRLDTHGAGWIEAQTGKRVLAPGEEWRGSATLATRGFGTQ